MGLYDHAYAPIGNDNALYTPMPRDMFGNPKFDGILMPDKTKTISTRAYIEQYKPQKIYMALSYFQAFFNDTLPQSYSDSISKQSGAPKKKLKTQQGDMELEPELPDM